MPQTKPWTFREVHQEVIAARAWADAVLVGAGFSPTAGSRLDQLERDIDAMAVASETKDVGQFSDSEQYKAGVYSLLEGRDFARIHQTFLGHETPGLAKRLDLAVRGPRAGIDETAANSEARNCLAELSWAALVKVSGFNVDIESDPTLASDPDVVLLMTTPQARYGMTWEVKRPTSTLRVEDRLKDGARQVRRTFQTGKVAEAVSVGGVVVLVMDYVIGARPVVLADSPPAAEALMFNRLKLWWDINEKVIRKSAKKEGVLGVVLWWRPLGIVGNELGIRIPYECTQLLFDDRLGNGEALEAARAIVHKLRWP